MKNIPNITPQTGTFPVQGKLSDKNDLTFAAKEIETIFLNEFLRIMMEQTSFGKDRTVSTFMPVITAEVSKALSEKGIGISEFIRGHINLRMEGAVESGKGVEDNDNNYNKKPLNSPVTGRVTSGYGMRIDPIEGKWRKHNGIDISVPEGTPIMPAAPGRVIFSGMSGGYGNCVVVEHENGITSLYAHNSINYVKSGDYVDNGKVIALSGSTGRSTGPHLHFEIRREGEPVNPEGMIG